MKHLKQPNRWSCLPTSFAMALGWSFDELICEIGHDGSKILWPELGDPWKRQAFHIDEILRIIYLRNRMAMPLDFRPRCAPAIAKAEPNEIDHISFLEDIVMPNNVGVLLGTTSRGGYHAVAWDGVQILDPNGRTYDLENQYFQSNSFYLIR